jgi:acyl carrier protein
MNTLNDFVAILHDDLGLRIRLEDVGEDLDRVADWDSAHLLQLMTVLERETGRPVALPDLLGASSLAEMYELAIRDRGHYDT